jgi:undecaprenyl-diphosphatase
LTVGAPLLDATTAYWLLALAAVVVLFVLQYRSISWVQVARRRPAILIASSTCAAAVFAKLASEVQEHETGELDRAVSLAVHRLDSAAMDAVMKFFSFLGSFPIAATVVVAAAIWQLRRHDRPGALLIVGVSLTAELCNLALKETFQRTRPSLFQEIATLHSYSFPSGHAMGSAAVYGALAVSVARSVPRWRKPAFAIASALILLIGLSRIYLGVHWLTDVLAGWAAGLAIALIGTLFLDLRRLPSRGP